MGHLQSSETAGQENFGHPVWWLGCYLGGVPLLNYVMHQRVLRFVAHVAFRIRSLTLELRLGLVGVVGRRREPLEGV